MISALRALWACVDVGCVFVCVCLWVCVGVWSRHEAGSGASVLWCSMAFLQSPGGCWTFMASQALHRPFGVGLGGAHHKHTLVKDTQPHTHFSSSSPAFIRGATSSQACSLTLQRALPLSLSVTSLDSGLILSFLELVFFLCPFMTFFVIFFLYSTICFPVYFPLFCHEDISFTWLNMTENT